MVVACGTSDSGVACGTRPAIDATERAQTRYYSLHTTEQQHLSGNELFGNEICCLWFFGSNNN